ncbi:MAG: ABC transporter permease, partial [Gammaproteobacteria bacterium]|nr:ABC transporter permease [Gammaproteobacteria bacterium]
MSLIAFLGAIESGLIFALVALGIYLSFRVLEFPDLTVDGSFPLGAAVSATLIVSGWNPWLATGVAILAGAMAGILTGWLNVQLKILNLLASILTMIALYSINLRIMGRPNVALLGEETILTPIENFGNGFDIPFYVSTPIVFVIIVVICTLALLKFLNSETGLALRATGANARMARAQGVKTSWMILIGMALSNALVALAGSLFAQSQGSADVTMGVGVIVVGLASVIGGEAIISPGTVLKAA